MVEFRRPRHISVVPIDQSVSGHISLCEFPYIALCQIKIACVFVLVGLHGYSDNFATRQFNYHLTIGSMFISYESKNFFIFKGFKKKLISFLKHSLVII